MPRVTSACATRGQRVSASRPVDDNHRQADNDGTNVGNSFRRGFTYDAVG